MRMLSANLKRKKLNGSFRNTGRFHSGLLPPCMWDSLERNRRGSMSNPALCLTGSICINLRTSRNYAKPHTVDGASSDREAPATQLTQLSRLSRSRETHFCRFLQGGSLRAGPQAAVQHRARQLVTVLPLRLPL